MMKYSFFLIKIYYQLFNKKCVFVSYCLIRRPYLGKYY